MGFAVRPEQSQECPMWAVPRVLPEKRAFVAHEKPWCGEARISGDGGGALKGQRPPPPSRGGRVGGG